MATPPSDEVVAHVIQEVDDMLDAGRVGLYEFCEVLRSDIPGPTEDEYVEIARYVYAQMLARGGIRLVWYVWPLDLVPGPATAGEDRAHWETPRGGVPYPAIERVD
jgi:hypothetical protein